VLPLLLFGCGDDDTVDATATTTTPFEGATTPTSSASSATSVALLVDVEVTASSVTFTFEEGAVPGFEVAYVEPPVREDGSGERVEVDGAAILLVRFEPAAGVDLAGEDFRPTYIGPERLPGPGSGVVVEAVRIGDFEANLTWAIGLDAEAPFRVDAGADGITVSVAPG